MGIFLISMFLLQFIYLVNELKLRILKISQQRGGVGRTPELRHVSLFDVNNHRASSSLTPNIKNKAPSKSEYSIVSCLL